MRCSVVICTYNKARYLEKTLHSIRSQDVPFDYEVVVVDDGSTDDTRAVCQRFGVSYRHIDKKGVRNLSVPKNVGFRLARGEILINQNDDVIHHYPDTLEKLVTAQDSGAFTVATVYNVVEAEDGLPTPAAAPVTSVNRDSADRPFCGPGGELVGPNNPIPVFHLGALNREDVYALGGMDEEFTKYGYEDCWFADCLLMGRKLRFQLRADIVGHHLHHPVSYVPGEGDEMLALWRKKQALGVYVSSGGPWQ